MKTIKTELEEILVKTPTVYQKEENMFYLVQMYKFMLGFDYQREFLFSFCYSINWFILAPLQGAGTNEKVLTEILASRTPAEVQNIKQVYLQGNFLYKIRVSV